MVVLRPNYGDKAAEASKNSTVSGQNSNMETREKKKKIIHCTLRYILAELTLKSILVS